MDAIIEETGVEDASSEDEQEEQLDPLAQLDAAVERAEAKVKEAGARQRWLNDSLPTERAEAINRIDHLDPSTSVEDVERLILRRMALDALMAAHKKSVSTIPHQLRSELEQATRRRDSKISYYQGLESERKRMEEFLRTSRAEYEGVKSFTEYMWETPGYQKKLRLEGLIKPEERRLAQIERELDQVRDSMGRHGWTVGKPAPFDPYGLLEDE